jgi:CheY-like chemotaxis protein
MPNGSSPSSSELLSQARGRSEFERIRVLIAEDEFFVGIQIAGDLNSAGYSSVGPFTTLEAAARASRFERFDAAILDINLNGTMVYPLADELSERGLPFIFLTGYLAKDLPERFRSSPQVTKPYDPAVLIKKIQTAIAKVD